MKATRTVVLLALLAAACTTKGENSALVITKVLTSKGTTTAGVTKPTNTSRRVRVHDRRAGRGAGQGSARSVVTSIRSTG